MAATPDRVQRVTSIDSMTLFTLLLTHALDEDGVNVAAVTPIVERRFGYKESRLRMIYPQADPYVALTTDGIDQLTEIGLLTGAGPGQWVIGPKFQSGKPVVAIRKGRGIPRAIRVTVYDADARQGIEAETEAQGEQTALAALLSWDGPGFRDLDPERVDHLEQSMRDEGGYLTHHPIIVDQYGRLIDGRHRRAAARRLNLHPNQTKVKVSSDAEAIRWALKANDSEKWSDADWDALELRVYRAMEHPTQQRERRIRIEIELARDPARSDRLIAGLVGSTAPTVGRTRKLMEGIGEIVRPERATGLDGKSYPTEPRMEEVPQSKIVPEPDSESLQVLSVTDGDGESISAGQDGPPAPLSISDQPDADGESLQVPSVASDDTPSPSLEQPKPAPPRLGQGRIERNRLEDPEYVRDRLVDELRAYATVPLADWWEAFAELSREQAQIERKCDDG